MVLQPVVKHHKMVSIWCLMPTSWMVLPPPVKSVPYLHKLEMLPLWYLNLHSVWFPNGFPVPHGSTAIDQILQVMLFLLVYNYGTKDLLIKDLIRDLDLERIHESFAMSFCVGTSQHLVPSLWQLLCTFSVHFQGSLSLPPSRLYIPHLGRLLFWYLTK